MVSSIAIKELQFNISYLFAHIVCSVLAIDGTPSGATTPGHSGPGSNGNEEVASSFKAGASPSDCLMSYAGHWLVVVLPL